MKKLKIDNPLTNQLTEDLFKKSPVRETKLSPTRTISMSPDVNSPSKLKTFNLKMKSSNASSEDGSKKMNTNINRNLHNNNNNNLKIFKTEEAIKEHEEKDEKDEKDENNKDNNYNTKVRLISLINLFNHRTLKRKI